MLGLVTCCLLLEPVRLAVLPVEELAAGRPSRAARTRGSLGEPRRGSRWPWPSSCALGKEQRREHKSSEGRVEEGEEAST
jgi:hypothetical protein